MHSYLVSLVFLILYNILLHSNLNTYAQRAHIFPSKYNKYMYNCRNLIRSKTLIIYIFTNSVRQ